MEENNKLIAEFMDYRIENQKFQYQNYNSSNESYWEWDEGDIVTLDGQEVSDYNNEPFYSLEGLPFYEWNWLIPVVEKIESIEDEHHGHFGVWINSNNCHIQGTKFRSEHIGNPPIYFSDHYGENKLEATYNAVVAFIKWRNKTLNTNCYEKV